jgi:hypothetical protein
MSYTEFYMRPILPESGALPSIGSVAENFARNEDTDFRDFICSTTEAQSVRTSFGEPAYEAYAEQLLHARKVEAAKAQRKMLAASSGGSKRSKAKCLRWLSKFLHAYKDYYRD